jgi:hypothetical protein
MDFRRLFLAVLLGIVASLWMTESISVAHAGMGDGSMSANACAPASCGDVLESGGTLPGETDEFGYETRLPGTETSRPATAPIQAAQPYRDIALPVPHRPPALA